METNNFHGDRLRLARLMSGMTQQELGHLVTVSRQFVHQMESGDKSPADDVWAALAEVLKVKPAFFNHSIINDVKYEQCHFRKRKTTPVGLANRVLALGTIFELLVEILDHHLELPEPDFPAAQVDSPDADALEREAESCRKHWELGLMAPISNMVRVLENAGAVITSFDDVSDKVDALSINRKRPIVVLNRNKGSSCRIRFDLAHECGHLILHQGLETGCTQTEKEADCFASAFLFPRSAFLKEFEGCVGPTRIRWERIYALKRRWRMSARAIIYRANYLGLLTAQQYRTANVFLSKGGRTEEYDDEIPYESPEILGAALDIIYSQMGVSIFDIADSLGVSEEIIAQLTGYDLSKQVEEKNVTSLLLHCKG